MSLKDKIKADMTAAFKAKDTATRGTLSMLLSVLQNREIDKRTRTGESELTDEEIVQAISSEIKKRKESAATYEQAGRADTAAAELQEVAVLMRYMPEQMGEDEVRALIKEAIATTGATSVKDMGKVMAQVAPKVKGKFDGAQVNELVKQALG